MYPYTALLLVCSVLIVPLANYLGIYERKKRPLAPNAPLEAAFRKHRGKVPQVETEVSLTPYPRSSLADHLCKCNVMVRCWKFNFYKMWNLILLP